MYQFIFQCFIGNPCWNNSACINTEPGYQCRACPYGYTGTYEDALAWNDTRRIFQLYNTNHDPLYYQTCTDIDECAVNQGGCDTNSYCYNTPVSIIMRNNLCLNCFHLLARKPNFENFLFIQTSLS